MSDDLSNSKERKVYRVIIVAAAVAFIVLPFVTSFNELLTKIVESLRLVAVIQGVVAPFVVRVVSVVLQALGMPTSIDGSFLYLDGGWMPLRIYINWNCVGWQSFILLVFTLVTGLQGPYTLSSKLLTVLIGFEGTFLVNVVRITIPAVLAYHRGYIPAIVFHDYVGTVLTLLWMGVFWSFAFENILMQKTDALVGSKEFPRNVGEAVNELDV